MIHLKPSNKPWPSQAHWHLSLPQHMDFEKGRAMTRILNFSNPDEPDPGGALHVIRCQLTQDAMEVVPL